MSTDDAHAYLKRRRFEELMDAGMRAYRDSQYRLAHDLWREAATLDPYNERVWLALLRVLETDEDRIVCLQNVIAINPLNVEARRRLHAYQQTPVEAPAAAPARPRPGRARLAQLPSSRRTPARRPNRRRSLLRRMLFVVVIGVALGVLAGIVASILLYAT